MADRPASPPPSGVTPLVGRERERARLREHLAAALAGQGTLVLVGGEAGIGKTALAEALLAEAAEHGALALVGRCYDLSETPPYGPWREAFARAPGGDHLPALPTAVLPVDREGAALPSREAIVARVRDYLAALAAARPLVVLLEDLHWADPASLDLLRAVARRLADLPALLVGTYRVDELAQHHPLFALLPLLVREARAGRLDLRPLDGDAVGALVAARYALAGPERARLVAYLVGRTEGNPLFLGELLRTLEGEGLVRRDGEGWVVGDLAAAPVPALLLQVIAGRAARLPPETRRLLAIAAVIGQEVPLALWAAVGGAAEEDLLDRAERALEARLLAETPEGAGVRFTHALVREALYEGTPALRRRRAHRLAGEALAGTPAPDPDAVAYHFQRAGDARAAEWLARAGERAQRAYAYLSAAGRFEAAAALLLAGRAATPAAGWLLYRAGIMHISGDGHRGLAALERAARVAAATGDERLLAYVTYFRGMMRCNAGAMREGLAELAAGAALIGPAAPAAPLRFAATGAFVALPSVYDEYNPEGALVLWLAWAGRLAEARALGEANVARAAGSARAGTMRRAALGDAYFGLGIALAGQGRPAGARGLFARAREAYGLIDQQAQIGETLWAELQYALLPYEADRLAERARLAAAAERAWVLAGEVLVWPVRLGRVPLLLLEGRWTEARALVEPGPVTRWPWSAARAQLAREQGDAALARAVIREHLPDGPASRPGGDFFDPALLLQRLAAQLALDAGDLPAARAWLAAHDRWLAWGGGLLGRAEGYLGWAAYHRAAGDLAAAREQAAAALAHASAPRQPLALLAAHRLLGELDTAAGRHAEARDHLAAALALADACAAPYERALTLLALAEVRLAIEDRAGAAAAIAEARVALADLDARPALARADALASRLASAPAPAPAARPFGLTAREAEVLRLLAEGLPDAQVAARLFVSRHTVNAHTKAIYAKLGVASRGAAARLAREHGLA